MKYEVFWTKEAEDTFDQNLSYLQQHWNQKVLQTFIARTDECIGLISQSPRLFPVISKRKKIHRCRIVKQVTLYYKITNNQIHLLTFWNNFQNPKKLKLK